MLENPNIVPFQDPTFLDLQWMFGAQIGKDTSSNFALSLEGLAVRTIDNRFVVPVLEGSSANLIDVTGLTIGIDPYVFRIPIAFESVRPGHLLVRSDSPFSTVFVEKAPDVNRRRIHGIDPTTDEVVEIIVPEKSLDIPSFLVRVISLFDGFDGEGLGTGSGDDFNVLLPFLLGSGSNAPNNLLLAMALSKGRSGSRNLGLILLLAGGSQSNSAFQSLLLSSALSGGKGLFGFGQRRSRHDADQPGATQKSDQPKKG